MVNANVSLNDIIKKMTLLLFMLVSLATSSPCHICGQRGNTAIRQPLGMVNNKSCAEAALASAKNAPGSQDCRRDQQVFQRCCDGSTNLPMRANKPKPPPVVHYKGPHPVCHLCLTGEYPATTSMVINLLYMGTGSCKDYYIAGREGRVSAVLCDPLRYFAQEPCGCPKPHRARSFSPIQEDQLPTWYGVLAYVAIGYIILHFVITCYCVWRSRYGMHRVTTAVSALEAKLNRLQRGSD